MIHIKQFLTEVWEEAFSLHLCGMGLKARTTQGIQCFCSTLLCVPETSAGASFLIAMNKIVN